MLPSTIVVVFVQNPSVETEMVKVSLQRFEVKKTYNCIFSQSGLTLLSDIAMQLITLLVQ